MVHQFDESYARGREDEKKLDEYFNRWYDVFSVPRLFQRFGIDRIMRRLRDRVSYSVEYKGDGRTAETGNLFLEVVSVDSNEKEGWALSCAAQRLVYYVLGKEIAYIMDPLVLKQHIRELEKRFKTRPAENVGYSTHGVLVPVGKAKEIHGLILTTVQVTDAWTIDPLGQAATAEESEPDSSPLTEYEMPVHADTWSVWE